MKKEKQFKTTIGGQALIEGIMMRGPEKDAVVVRGKDGLTVEVSDRKIRSKRSPLAWPFIRGVVNFVDSMSVGTKALMRSADLCPEEDQEDVKKSRVDAWLERKMQDKKFQNTLMGIATALGLLMSIGLFFLLPGLIMSFFTDYIPSVIVRNLLEGAIRISILVGYLYLASRQKDVKRLFAYHGAEHKTIACYEAGLELTVENVRKQKRFHPRCGTSLLFVIMFLSILVFSVGEHLLLAAAPGLPLLGGFLYNLIRIGFKLLLLPLVLAITYEINRWVGKHDNWFTAILAAPGLWIQRISTKEPDDDMIEVGITAVNAVLPEEKGADQW